jgi:hypothetical protein
MDNKSICFSQNKSFQFASYTFLTQGLKRNSLILKKSLNTKLCFAIINKKDLKKCQNEPKDLLRLVFGL